jgi:hypothetical protein
LEPDRDSPKLLIGQMLDGFIFLGIFVVVGLLYALARPLWVMP